VSSDGTTSGESGRTSVAVEGIGRIDTGSIVAEEVSLTLPVREGSVSRMD
jgi:hypothetical protein